MKPGWCILVQVTKAITAYTQRYRKKTTGNAQVVVGGVDWLNPGLPTPFSHQLKSILLQTVRDFEQASLLMPYLMYISMNRFKRKQADVIIITNPKGVFYYPNRCK